MFGDEILGAIKGLGEVVIKGIDEFTVSAEEKMAYKLKMQEAIFQSQKAVWELEVKDRDSARQREIAIKDKTVSNLAYIIVASFVVVGMFMVIHPYIWPGLKIEPEMIGLIGTVVGYLAAKAEQVASYYFGSSQSSSDKTKILDRVMNHKS